MNRAFLALEYALWLWKESVDQAVGLPSLAILHADVNYFNDDASPLRRHSVAAWRRMGQAKLVRIGKL